MALFGVSPAASKPAALVMNVAVATLVTLRFSFAGLVPWRRLAPLVLGSVPAAFVGGVVELPTSLHRVVLGAVLAFAACGCSAASEIAPGRCRVRRSSSGSAPRSASSRA
jgi:uncharacterized membrane protein YfcA